MSDTDTDCNPPAHSTGSGERNLIFASPECGELFGALAEAQGKMGNPKKTKTASVKGTTRDGKAYSYDYKYAPLEEVVDVIRSPMSEAGLIYRQFLAQREGSWVMRTVIAHKSGQWYGCDYPLFADKPGAQGFASGVTYARRYGLMLALGLVGEDDDDANVADGHPVATVYGKAQTAPPRSRAASPPPAPPPADDPFPDDPPHPAGNGRAAPLPPHPEEPPAIAAERAETLDQFWERDDYGIAPEVIPGGMARWDAVLLALADAAPSLDAFNKLRDDNLAHYNKWAATVAKPVVDHMGKRMKLAFTRARDLEGGAA